MPHVPGLDIQLEVLTGVSAPSVRECRLWKPGAAGWPAQRRRQDTAVPLETTVRAPELLSPVGSVSSKGEEVLSQEATGQNSARAAGLSPVRKQKAELTMPLEA